MALQLCVDRFDLLALSDLAGLELAVAGVDHLYVVHHAPALHLAVGRLNEPEIVDPRVAGKRADETDVWTLRRLNRTNAAVVRGVDVANLESSAFARQSARPQGREAALVRDFG